MVGVGVLRVKPALSLFFSFDLGAGPDSIIIVIIIGTRLLQLVSPCTSGGCSYCAAAAGLQLLVGGTVNISAYLLQHCSRILPSVCVNKQVLVIINYLSHAIAFLNT